MKIKTLLAFFIARNKHIKAFLRIMRISFFLLFVCVFQLIATNTEAQNATMELEANVLTVGQLISQIEKQTEFLVIFRNREIDTERTIRIRNTSGKVASFLQAAFDETDIQYEFTNNYILLSKKEPEKEKAEPVSGLPVQLQLQQKKEITGVVTDENNQPIPGVNIVEKGTVNGVTTDINGFYRIEVGDNAVLQVSYIGFNRIEVPAGKTPLNIQMQEDAQALDEVVVIGYGTQRKVTVTGSISTLKGETIKQTPSANLSNNVVGRITGVIANNRSGEPGSDWSTILVRGKGTTGDNSPLYVIDGVANRGNFERLNPSDIESITVLKDASAAIYGAQAANGVILVTTKRGTSGKPTITYDGNFGLSQPTRLPKLLSGYQYMVYKDEANRFEGLPERFGDVKNKYLDGTIDGINLADTDWMDVIFRTAAPQTQHSLSIRGGNDRVHYFVSGGYLYQEPLYKSTVGNNYNTVQIRSNIDAKITKDLTMTVELSARREDRFNSNYSANKIFTETMNIYPYVPAFYPNGLPSAGISKGLNPAILTTGVTGYYKNIDKFLNTKVGFDLQMPWITKGLSASGYIAFDTQTGKEKTFNDRWDAYQYVKDEETGEFVYKNIREETNEQGSITLSQGAYDNERTTVHMKLSYERQFGPHHIAAFIAYEQSKYNSEGISASRKYYLSGQIQLLSAGSDAEKNNNGWGDHNARQNYFSRVEYNYGEKYLASFTIRRDGSCNFAPGKRWGTFPAGSVGWMISEEEFIKSRLDFMENLKLRASWGRLGNDRVSAFQYLSTYSLANGPQFGSSPVRVKGFNEGVTPNTGITWETIDSKNIGLEGSFWNGKLGFDLNYFYANRTGVLIKKNASVPGFAAINLPSQNLGKIKNRGVEVELSHRNRIGNVDYYLGGNMTLARNKVVYMDEAIDVPDWQKKTGYAIDSWQVYRTDGIYQTQEEVDSTPHLPNAQPGDIKYVDVDDNGEITARDMVRIRKGNIPQLVYGIPMGASWKGIELNILWQGQALAKQLVLPQNLNIDVEYFKGRWISAAETPNAKYPRAYNHNNPINDEMLDFWLKDASFLRLKSVELAYNFNSRLLRNWNISNLRVYLSGSNLLCFDKIKILDPETAAAGGQYYPQTRVFNVGVNLSF